MTREQQIERLRTVRSRMHEAERHIDGEHYDRQSTAYHNEAQAWRGEYNELCGALGIVTIRDERAVLGLPPL
jgi:hypothetical protein